MTEWLNPINSKQTASFKQLPRAFVTVLAQGRPAKQREGARVWMRRPPPPPDLTFVWVFRDTDAQSEMQLLFAGLARRCWNTGSLLQGDSCWQGEVQLASGSPDDERRIAGRHGHVCGTSGHIFPGEQQMQTDTSFREHTHKKLKTAESYGSISAIAK